ncbi:MAG TPA: hypothetical protein PK765_05225 [bacterium]|nr:hypothetical protein [bacterium]
MFENQELLPLYQSLLGYESDKPFECVGTHEESLHAAIMALARDDRPSRPIFLEWFNQTIVPTLSPLKAESLATSPVRIDWKATCVPERFVKTLEKYFDFQGKKR